MGLLSRFFRRVRRPDASSLGSQIASKINLFVAVRGLDSLLKSETAIVMRKDYEISITQDVDGLEDRKSVIALVYLKDMESYNDFKDIQTDASSRNSALGQMATDYLANQAARKLLQKIGQA